MKNEFKPGEFCRFPNEEIPRVLDILRANGHPLWKSTAVYQRDQDIIACSNDGDLMGYWSKEPEIKTELSRHDFLVKALRLEEGMGMRSDTSTPDQRAHISSEMEKVGIKIGMSIKLYSAERNSIIMLKYELAVCSKKVPVDIPYLEWCKRLCVEPIGQVDTLQDGDWFEGTLDQYAEAKRLSNLCNGGVYDPYKFAYHAIKNDNHALYVGEWICYNGKECGATTNKLTAEEFLRRARNTFQEPTHKEVTPEMTGANIYPLTIVSDRYNGAYSGALFLAFNLDPCDIPDEIGAGDGDEMAFYEGDGHKKYKIGKGRTANDAAANLYCILNTPEFNASMLEVGEWMEITEIGPYENCVVQKMQNGYFYCPEYAEVISNDALKGRRVDVEIKVTEP